MGTGPSLKDLHDIPALCRERTVIAFNKAINVIPQAACCFIVDPNIPEQCKLTPETPVVIAKCLESAIVAAKNWRRICGFILEHPKLEIVDTDRDGVVFHQGVLNHCLEWLNRSGMKEVELYGIDLDDSSHIYMRPGLFQHFGHMTLWNCCPSSVLPQIPKKEVPWAGKG